MRKRYTEDEKALGLAALASHQGNLSGAAKACGLPRNTLREWRDGLDINDTVSEVRQAKTEAVKAELSERFEATIHKLLDAMPGAICDASLKEIAVAVGILADKRLALLPTVENNTDTVGTLFSNLTDDELNHQIAVGEERTRDRSELRITG